jgi:hypothetical protein
MTTTTTISTTLSPAARAHLDAVIEVVQRAEELCCDEADYIPLMNAVTTMAVWRSTSLLAGRRRFTASIAVPYPATPIAAGLTLLLSRIDADALTKSDYLALMVAVAAEAQKRAAAYLAIVADRDSPAMPRHPV